MERVFKISTKSSINPNGLYPSERRYSASIVLGLSIVFFQLFLCSILMSGLIIHKINLNTQFMELHNATSPNQIEEQNGTFILVVEQRNEDLHLEQKIERDSMIIGHGFHYYIDAPALISGGCFLMAFGALLSFVAGTIAWKRWYIDHNITFFFLFASFSILTASINLLLTFLTILNMNFSSPIYDLIPVLTLPLTSNILILSLVTFVWSIISSRVGYRGMRNTYPNDTSGSGGVVSNVEVTTTGNTKSGKSTNLPPLILNNLHEKAREMAKYLPPKKVNNDLPKDESNEEYEQRVNKFLEGQGPEEGTVVEKTD